MTMNRLACVTAGTNNCSINYPTVALEATSLGRLHNLLNTFEPKCLHAFQLACLHTFGKTSHAHQQKVPRLFVDGV